MRNLVKCFLGSVGLVLAAYSTAWSMAADGPVVGFGSDLPLGQAIDDIVPNGLNIVIANTVDPSVLISWEGGSSWKSVLRTALGRVGLFPKISDTEVVIDLAPPPPQDWQVFEGDTVAQTVSRWSSQAGYTPVPAFAAQERWRLFVSQHYEGTFEEALEWLSKGFSRQPSRPVFYLGGNKTIDILSQPTGISSADTGAGRF